jgi:hypothetical protein
MSESAVAQVNKTEVQGATPVLEALLGFVTLALACFAATWCPDGLGRDIAWFVFVGAWAVLAQLSFPRFSRPRVQDPPLYLAESCSLACFAWR